MIDGESSETRQESPGCECVDPSCAVLDSDDVGARPGVDGRGVVEFRIEDMDCASCMATIRAGLNRQPGFIELTGSPVSRSLTVTYDENLTDAEALRRSIGDLGYRAHAVVADSMERVQIWRSRRAVLTYVSGAFFLAGLLVRLVAGEGLAAHSSGCGAPP